MFYRVVRSCRPSSQPGVCVRCSLALALRGLSGVAESRVSSGGNSDNSAATFNAPSPAAKQAVRPNVPPKPKQRLLAKAKPAPKLKEPPPAKAKSTPQPQNVKKEATMTIGEAMKAQQTSKTAPVQKTASPVKTTPIQKTASPVKTTPVPKTAGPLKTVTVQKAESPMKKTATPVKKAPVPKTAVPVQKATTPTLKTAVPVQKSAVPVEKTAARKTAGPVKTIPVPKTASPVKKATEQETAVPVENTAVPVEEAPPKTTTGPTNRTAISAKKTILSGKKTVPVRKTPAMSRPARRLPVSVESVAPARRLTSSLYNSGTNALAREPPMKRSKQALYKAGTNPVATEVLSSMKLKISVIDPPHKTPVPTLSYGLERVLFNRGVYELQDPRTRVYNFDPYLQSIMPVSEFDFSALKKYVTSSKDKTLQWIAAENKRKYSGSSSSMTSMLSQFHYLLSAWRPLNTNMLSKHFPADPKTFTAINRAPAAIFLKRNETEGTYAIDADKEFDSANILSMLGRSMEKLLTLPKEGYERYRKQNSSEITEEEKNEPEAFHYSTMGDFLMRSQLDAYDPRLPGTGTFDLKTRAVVTVRMDAANYQMGYDYEIINRQGQWESYEREFFDMMRSAFMKYSLQVRMGRMDGIFVAFHNTQRIFGFQYVSLNEMDETIHGTQNTIIGDTEFRLSIGLLNKILDKVTEKIPNSSVRMHFETREGTENFMYVFAEAVTSEQMSNIQSSTKKRVEAFENELMGLVSSEEPLPTEAGAAEEAFDTEEPSADAVEALIARLVAPEADFAATSPIDAAQGEPLSSKHFSSPAGTAATDDVDSVATSTPTDTSTPSPTDGPQVYGWVLTLRNKINGEPVLRPNSLHEKDAWTVEYHFAEISTSQRTQSLYNACRARRQKALEKIDDDDSYRIEVFLKQMRNLSKKGKRFRMQRDKEDLASGNKIVVL